MLELAAQEALGCREMIDLLLLTATDIETSAVASVLAPLPGRGDVLFTHIENHTYRLGRFGPFGAAHLQCVMGTRDAGSAISATTEAARCWTPRAVVMPGIAWGSPDRKFGLGDVLVATSVQDFENVKVGVTHEFRSPETQSGPKLIDRFRNVDAWKFELPEARTSARHLGLILSGDKLIANAEFRDNLLREFKRANGGDMESYGVAQACRALGLEWIVVKGICDWGDEQKDDSWQSVAAAASVSLCVAALRTPSALHGLSPAVQYNDVSLRSLNTSLPLDEIPPAIDRLVGRIDEMQVLAEGLGMRSQGMSLCLVVGMGGIGKTLLAAETARQLLGAGTFPDGVIWHETYEQSPTQAMAHVIGAFGGATVGLDAAKVQSTYRRIMSERRFLLVVDNALSAHQVAPLLADSSESALLVTSRNHMPTLRRRASTLVDLGRMQANDAIELLSWKAGLSLPEYGEGLGRIADLCGYLPLALSIAGALLGERDMWPNVASFEEQLRKQRLDALAIDGCPDQNVRAVLLLSYEQMDASLARGFRSLSVLGRESFGASAVASILGETKEETIALLAALIGRSVLERSSLGRYVIHDLLRDMATELFDRDEPESTVTVLRQRAAAYWSIWLQAQSNGTMAAACSRKGDADKAIEYFEEAQALNAEIGNRQGQAHALGGIAAAYAKKGKADKAIEYHERARVLSEQIGDRMGQARAFGGIAAAYAKKGNADRAIECFQKAQTLNEEIGDRHGQAHALGGIAAAYAKKGNADTAIEYFQKAQALNEGIGDRHGQAHALGGIAAAYAKKGDTGKAIEYFQEAQTLNEEIGDGHGQAHALGGIAAAYAKKGDADKAIEYHERAQALSEKIGDWKGQAHALGGIASSYANKGNAATAIEYHQKAQELSEKIGDWKGQAHALGGIAACYAKKGDADKAIIYYAEAQQLNEKIGDKHGQAHALGGIAAAYARKGDADRAVEYHEKARSLSDEIGDWNGQARALGSIAGIFARTGKEVNAIEYYKKALEVDEAVGNWRYIANTLSALLRLARSTGDDALAQFCQSRLRRRQ